MNVGDPASSPLSTPPSSVGKIEDDPPTLASQSLFTPPSSSIPLPRSRRLMSHVEVPDFPGGITAADYAKRPSLRRDSMKKATLRKKASASAPTGGHKVHQNIGDALASAFAGNAKSGAIPDGLGSVVLRKRKPGRPPMSSNAIAGPSSLSAPVKRNSTKKSDMEDHDYKAGAGPNKKAKLMPPRQKVATSRKRKQDKASVWYDAAEGVIRMLFDVGLDGVEEALFANTRFLRMQEGHEAIGRKGKGKERETIVSLTGSPDRSWFPWPSLSRSAYSAADEIDGKEVSAGGSLITWEVCDANDSEVDSEYPASTETPRARPKEKGLPNNASNFTPISTKNDRPAHRPPRRQARSRSSTVIPETESEGESDSGIGETLWHRSLSPDVSGVSDEAYQHSARLSPFAQNPGFAADKSSPSHTQMKLDHRHSSGGIASRPITQADHLDVPISVDPINPFASAIVDFPTRSAPSVPSDAHSLLPPMNEPVFDSMSPWMVDNTYDYENGTIDPSLLGGPSLMDLVVQEDRQASPAHSIASSASSSSSVSVALQYVMQPKQYSPHSSASSPLSESSSSRAPFRVSLRRPAPKQIPSDMIPSHMVDMEDSYSEDSDSSSSDNSDVHESPAKAHAKPLSNPKKPQPNLLHIGPPWPTGGVEYYCHQCRGKSFRLRMLCRCQKSYCIKCVSR